MALLEANRRIEELSMFKVFNLCGVYELIVRFGHADRLCQGL